MSSTLPVAQNGAADSPLNVFGARKPSTATVEVESQRAIAETQAAMVIAQRFPRNGPEAMDRILQAFTRPTLAEKALYSYARGGTEITGPSIRAAEAIAQEYGNLQFGVRELDQRAGISTVETYCWDVQTNTRSSKVFQVTHVRHTRKGQTHLEDPRDIYELVANQGARRLRACILSVIPSDVVEAAIKQAERTLRTNVQVTPELIASLVEKFESVGVSRRMLEAKIQRRLDAVTPALVVQLGKIFNAIEDGIANVGDHFQVEESTQTGEDGDKSRIEKLEERLAKKNQPTSEATSETPAADEATASELADAKAAPATDAADAKAKEIAAAQQEIDEKQKARALRTAILKKWTHVPTAMRSAILSREYAKPDMLGLTIPQLEDCLARAEELAPVQAPEGAE